MECFEGACVFDAYAGCQFFDAGEGAGPDDVVDVVVVGEDVVFACFAVEDAYEVFALEAEEVEEGAVLAEPVGVVFVVAGGFVVAGHDDEAVADVFAQLLAARDIGFFFEHGVLVFLFNDLDNGDWGSLLCGGEKMSLWGSEGEDSWGWMGWMGLMGAMMCLWYA